jgi:hypothetical protein
MKFINCFLGFWVIFDLDPDLDPGTPLNPAGSGSTTLVTVPVFIDCVNAFHNLRSTGDMLGNLLCLLTLGPDVLIRVVAGEGEGSVDFLVTVSGAD